MTPCEQLAAAAREMMDAIVAYNVPRTAAERLTHTRRYLDAWRALTAAIANWEEKG